MAQEKVQRIILTGPEVWLEWKTQLDVYAASIRAQDYLVLRGNVDKYNTVREPTIPSSVTEDSARLYHLQKEVFTVEDQRIQKLNDFIATTISLSYLIFLVARPSPYGRVQSLEEHLEPDSVDRDAVIQSHIQKLGSSLPRIRISTSGYPNGRLLTRRQPAPYGGPATAYKRLFLFQFRNNTPNSTLAGAGMCKRSCLQQL
ncbi:hypothetical protein V8E54_003028 [Elaphomyces granulatus]